MARAVEESRALMAKQEEELAAFKKYTTDNLEMQHEKGTEGLWHWAVDIGRSCLKSPLLKGSTSRRVDAA